MNLLKLKSQKNIHYQYALKQEINRAIRPLFYPVSSFPMYESCPNNIISQKIFSKGINLPSYFEMTQDDVIYLVNALETKLQE
ncbi:hypothetical protein N8298_01430 [Flavobacteriaceae bacterium]|nr:hypothetical protein [Flavobacteriaceae bacterium]